MHPGYINNQSDVLSCTKLVLNVINVFPDFAKSCFCAYIQLIGLVSCASYQINVYKLHQYIQFTCLIILMVLVPPNSFFVKENHIKNFKKTAKGVHTCKVQRNPLGNSSSKLVLYHI